MGRWQLDKFMFKPGEKSPVIREVRLFLHHHPRVKGKLADSHLFDAATQAALADFQKLKGLKDQSGSFNFETYAAIGKEMDARKVEHISAHNISLNILLQGVAPQDYQTCRLEALKTLGSDLKAKFDEFPNTLDKVQMIGVGVAAGGGSGATGGPLSAAIGAGIGGAAAYYAISKQEELLERGAVRKFWRAEAKCIAIEEELYKHGPIMRAAPNKSQNVFVVTRQFGTFALHPYYKALGYREIPGGSGKTELRYIQMPASPTDSEGRNTNPYLRR